MQSLIAPGVIAIGNAANARVKGLELETVAKPIPDLTLTANLSLLEAKYLKFPAASVPVVIRPLLAGNPRYSPATATFDASGNRLNAAPKSSFSASAQYDFDLGGGNAFIRGQYYWQDRAYYDPSNVEIVSQKAYDIGDIAVGYVSADGKWRTQLVVRNVADRKYLIVAATNAVVPSGLPGAPRTVALQVTREW